MAMGVALLLAASGSAQARDQPAPLVLIGGALHTCTSMATDHCVPGTVFPESDREIVAATATRSAASQRILQALLQASRAVGEREDPLLVLVTASSADALDAVDFYQQLFAQVGFRVHWLPLDAPLARVLDHGQSCAALDTPQATADPLRQALLNRRRDFCEDPSADLAVLQQADAVFFNGGDQSLTLQALLTPTGTERPWLTLIRQRHRAGQLVVAGTSAGTAVHSSGEMLMGGDSAAALRHGRIEGDAFQPPGEAAEIPGVLAYPRGSGLFPAGILDSHFAERGRWLRLAILLRDSRSELAFGVDETTALISEPAGEGARRLRVVGAGSVMVLQRTEAGLRLHSLVAGNEAVLDAGQLRFGPSETVTIDPREENRLLDAPMLAGDGLRLWLNSLADARRAPARAYLRPERADLPVWQLDFGEFAVLPGPAGAAAHGFRDLLLRWP
jgi:cyanophycinase